MSKPKLVRETPVASSSNGHGPKKHGEVTLGSGVTLPIRRVDTWLLADVYRAHKPPPPPTQVVDGLAGEEEVENYDHPDYRQALQEHQAEAGFHKTRVLIKYGVELMLTKEQDEELSEVLADLAYLGMDMGWVRSKRDRMAAFILYRMGLSQQDLATLSSAIAALSGPTEEAVEAAKATFPGDV